ncbi:hypothetical protein DFJ73DRAFT_881175, partial [Zopfochytrium polystomum]
GPTLVRSCFAAPKPPPLPPPPRRPPRDPGRRPRRNTALLYCRRRRRRPRRKEHGQHRRRLGRLGLVDLHRRRKLPLRQLPDQLLRRRQLQPRQSRRRRGRSDRPHYVGQSATKLWCRRRRRQQRADRVLGCELDEGAGGLRAHLGRRDSLWTDYAEHDDCHPLQWRRRYHRYRRHRRTDPFDRRRRVYRVRFRRPRRRHTRPVRLQRPDGWEPVALLRDCRRDQGVHYFRNYNHYNPLARLHRADRPRTRGRRGARRRPVPAPAPARTTHGSQDRRHGRHSAETAELVV